MSTIRKKVNVAVLVMGLSVVAAFGVSNQPNIIIINTDDLGYGDISCQGAEFPTPHIDSIAKNGMRFTQFYAAASVCTPSRYGLLTGAHPDRSKHKLTGAIMPWHNRRIEKNEKILPQYMKVVGYKTALIGKWHLSNNRPEYMPTNHGFDIFSGSMHGCWDYYEKTYGKEGLSWYVNNKAKFEKGYTTDLLTDYTINAIDQSTSEKKPFFVYLAYNAPHYGKTFAEDLNAPLPEHTISIGMMKKYKAHNTLQAPVEYLERVKFIKNKYRRYYAAMVVNLDDNIGRLLKELEKRNLTDNTIIWFMSDHGGYSRAYYKHASNGILRGQKRDVYEGGVRIPSLLQWKGTVAPGTENDQILSQLDIVPTFASMLGFNESLSKRELPVDGTDISSVILKNTVSKDRYIYWNQGKNKAIRSGDWKMVNKQLYNITNDISEKKNLAKKHPERLNKLEKMYRKLKKESTLTWK